MNNSNPIQLSYNANASLTTILPLGPSYNSYELMIFVQIIDDSNGITVYKLPYSVRVKPSVTAANKELQNLLNGKSNLFFSNNLKDLSKNIISLAYMFNHLSKINDSNSVIKILKQLIKKN